jgi:hypothetical protein
MSSPFNKRLLFSSGPTFESERGRLIGGFPADDARARFFRTSLGTANRITTSSGKRVYPACGSRAAVHWKKTRQPVDKLGNQTKTTKQTGSETMTSSSERFIPFGRLSDASSPSCSGTLLIYNCETVNRWKSMLACNIGSSAFSSKPCTPAAIRRIPSCVSTIRLKTHTTADHIRGRLLAVRLSVFSFALSFFTLLLFNLTKANS